MSDDTRSFLRRYYDDNALDYDGWMASYDKWFLGDARAALCAQAQGRTLELAVGTGLNLAHYSSAAQVTGLDYSPGMLARAKERAAERRLPITLTIGDAGALPFPDQSFDTVLTTLFLSSAPDPIRAIDEVHRVLAPGGRLLCIDHVRSDRVLVRLVERGIGPLLRKRTGVDLGRNPLDHLPAAGFVPEQVRHAKLGFIQTIAASRP